MPTVTDLPPLDLPRGYPVQVAAQYLGDVAAPTVYGLIREGKLASYMIGRRRFVRGSEIARYTAGDPPERAGAPIDEQTAAQKRVAGAAGGHAKAARPVAA